MGLGPSEVSFEFAHLTLQCTSGRVSLEYCDDLPACPFTRWWEVHNTTFHTVYEGGGKGCEPMDVKDSISILIKM